VVEPGTGEGNEIGMSARTAGDVSPIPGGLDHITNAPTVRQHVPIGVSRPEHLGILAHGVPPEAHTFRQRADLEKGPNDAKPLVPKYDAPAKTVNPIPVYVVEPAQGPRPLQTLAADSFTVPIKTSAPIRIASRDYARSHILLLVETAAGAAGAAPTGIRFDNEISNLMVGKGALLPAGAVSYLRMTCNDELFAVSNDGSACTLSVVFLYGIAGAG
jgi:hypothetical protein